MDEEFAQASERAWGNAAAAWSKEAEQPERGASAAVAEWMLQAAELDPGQRVLELACGAGRVGLQAARAVGPEGHVLCSDFAAPMVDAVRERASALGLGNVSARVLDAQALELGDEGRFDRVLCRFGYMLMADPAAALRESRRALADGGRLVLGVWGRADENPWLSSILRALAEHFDAPPPEPGTPGPFALGDPEGLEELLREAGFAGASATRLELEQEYESGAEWWDRMVAIGGPLAAALGAIPDADVAAIREVALGHVAEFTEGSAPAVFPAAAVVATAT